MVNSGLWEYIDCFLHPYRFHSHLENYNNKAPIIIENFTIEHIMPQNSNLKEEWKQALGENWKDIQKKYLHTIGNLTLTAYNSEMSDNPFMNKMTMPGGFQESALRLNSYVVKQTTWNEKCIVTRANLLADKAIEIWKYPVLTEDELKPYATPQKVAAGYSIESYDLNKDTRELFDVLDRRIQNIGAGVKREFKKLYAFLYCVAISVFLTPVPSYRCMPVRMIFGSINACPFELLKRCNFFVYNYSCPLTG